MVRCEPFQNFFLLLFTENKTKKVVVVKKTGSNTGSNTGYAGYTGYAGSNTGYTQDTQDTQEPGWINQLVVGLLAVA